MQREFTRPGDLLVVLLVSAGMTQRAFAALLGRPQKTISEIVTGKARVTEETAIQFEQQLGVAAEVWLSLDLAYRLRLARAKV